MKHPIYTLFGVAVLGLLALGQWTGASFSSINEVKNIPKSVRENPGVYRSHYGFMPRWFGGK
jgi:hypothetical protein